MIKVANANVEKSSRVAPKYITLKCMVAEQCAFIHTLTSHCGVHSHSKCPFRILFERPFLKSGKLERELLDNDLAYKHRAIVFFATLPLFC